MDIFTMFYLLTMRPGCVNKLNETSLCFCFAPFRLNEIVEDFT